MPLDLRVKPSGLTVPVQAPPTPGLLQASGLSLRSSMEDGASLTDRSCQIPSAPIDVSLLRFLEVDGRPCIILHLPFETSNRNFHELPVFQNDAFLRAYPSIKSQDTFVSHAIRQIGDLHEAATSFTFSLLGRPCIATVLSEKWIVVTWNLLLTVDDEPQPGPILSYLNSPTSKPVRDNWIDGLASPVQEQSIPTQEQKETWRRGAAILNWQSFPGMYLSPHQRFILDFPWHNTPLGPIDSWPVVLRLSVSASILNPDPRALYWGEDFICVYNEHCVPIFGNKHPMSMGTAAADSWKETWSIGEPLMTRALHEGKASKLQKVQTFFHRKDILEEVFFDSTFLPIPGVDGHGKGVLNQFQEVTDTVIAERQRAVINGVSDAAWRAEDVESYFASVVEVLREEPADVVFALVYLPCPEHAKDGPPRNTISSTSEFQLQHCLGLAGSQLIPSHIYDPSHPPDEEDPIIAAIRKAHNTDKIVTLSVADHSLPDALRVSIPDRGFGDDVLNAAVFPVDNIAGGDPVGFAIVGMNPRRPLDNRSRELIKVLRDTLTKGVAMARMPSQARQQQKKLEDLHQSLLQRLQHSDREFDRLQARFERMAGSSPIGMFMYQPDGTKPIYVNDEFLKTIDISREELDAKGWSDRIHEQDRERVLGMFSELIRTRKTQMTEFRTVKDFEFKDEYTEQIIRCPQYLIGTAMPEVDEDGEVLNLQGWIANVSEQRLTQRLLNSRLEEVTESKQNAENFIDMVSHEMRNPLSAILQSADGITSSIEVAAISLGDQAGLEGALGAQSRSGNLSIDNEIIEGILDASKTIVLCAQHQKRIVDDILTLSKLDANLLLISPDKTDPASLLSQALKMFEGQLERVGIKATIDICPAVLDLNLDFVMMDSSRVLQCIINLLTNAIKFTTHAKKRHITLALSASAANPSSMAKSELDLHFIPRRESRSRHQLSYEFGNGQDIFLTFMVRDTGKGLTPEEMNHLFQRFSQASPKTYKKYGGSGLGLFISRELVELQGGQIGVSSVAGKGSTFAFYVHTRRWLPATPMSDGKSIASIHTPTMLESPVAYSRRGSAAMYDTGAIAAAIQGTSGTTRLTPPPSNRPKDSQSGLPQPKLSILIVEDNEVNARVTSKQLRMAGHEVYVAEHGLEALDFLRRTRFWTGKASDPPASGDYLTRGQPPAPVSAGEQIDLSVILMDVEMPVLDGLSCVRQIRAMQERGELSGHVPVIAVTANARSEQIAVALAAGMDEVVTKPFRIWQVLERAALIVGRERSGR